MVDHSQNMILTVGSEFHQEFLMIDKFFVSTNQKIKKKSRLVIVKLFNNIQN